MALVFSRIPSRELRSTFTNQEEKPFSSLSFVTGSKGGELLPSLFFHLVRSYKVINHQGFFLCVYNRIFGRASSFWQEMSLALFTSPGRGLLSSLHDMTQTRHVEKPGGAERYMNTFLLCLVKAISLLFVIPVFAQIEMRATPGDFTFHFCVPFICGVDT